MCCEWRCLRQTTTGCPENIDCICEQPEAALIDVGPLQVSALRFIEPGSTYHTSTVNKRACASLLLHAYRHCPGLTEDQLYMYLQQFGRVTDVYLPKGL